MFLCPNDAPVLVEYFCPVFAVSSCWFGFGLHVTSFVLFGSFLLVGYLYVTTVLTSLGLLSSLQIVSYPGAELDFSNAMTIERILSEYRHLHMRLL